MIDLSDNGRDVDVRPDTITFTAVINARAKSQDGGALGAERVLRTMDEAGHMQLKPDNVTYRSVIDAWANSGEGDAGVRAEQILRRMINLSDSERDVDARPNNITLFSAVVNAWAKSKGGRAHRSKLSATGTNATGK